MKTLNDVAAKLASLAYANISTKGLQTYAVRTGNLKDRVKAYNTPNKLKGNIPEHDKERVLAGMINFYRQQGGKTMLPEPTCQWRV